MGRGAARFAEPDGGLDRRRVAAVVVALGAILAVRAAGEARAVHPDSCPPFDGPLRRSGALFQGHGERPHFCSGASVVDSPSGDVIATAAHCLSGDGQDLEFVPMYHDGQAPYGAWDVTGAYVSQRVDAAPGSPGGFRLPDPQPAKHRRSKTRTVQSVVGGKQLVMEQLAAADRRWSGTPRAAAASRSSASTRPRPGRVPGLQVRRLRRRDQRGTLAGRLRRPDRSGPAVRRDRRPSSGRLRELGSYFLEFQRRHDGGVPAGRGRRAA